MRRDSRLQADDTIAVFFDTFHDHRNGYVFRVNPLGTKYDATVKDETELNSQWDEKWEAAAQITERGWEAEMAIPWKAVRFPAGDHIWGMGFKREIRRRNEEVNWSSWRRGYDFRAVSQMGHLVGLKNLKLNGRYRLKPYVSGGYNDLNATEAPISEGNGDIGIEDFKVQITPNITADFTLKTDFAQVEDDEERVNLTRFPLFFPERREFFLESANVFRFGSASEHGGFGSPDALLFHSRRIGLVDGDPVPMNYGIKLTGKIGGSTIGVVNAGTGNLINAGNERVSGSNYSAVRWRQDILGRSYVGAMFTNVEGEGSKYNRVFGLDASFRFLEHASIGGYVAQARGNDINGGSWVGQFGAGWDSDLWSLNAGYSRVDEDFETDLGVHSQARCDQTEGLGQLDTAPALRLDAADQFLRLGGLHHRHRRELADPRAVGERALQPRVGRQLQRSRGEKVRASRRGVRRRGRGDRAGRRLQLQRMEPVVQHLPGTPFLGPDSCRRRRLVQRLA